MKISTSHIRYYRDMYNWSADSMSQGIDALVEKVGAQLGAIEEVVNFGQKYQGVVIAKVVKCEKHPNADKLNICKIDDGLKLESVEHDTDGLVQVVCGAPNVREGLTVAWLPPGSTVPESYGKEPFVLGTRELRGVVSNGMLASAKELALGDSHEGILEIDEEIAPGTLFDEYYGLAGDYALDIENKMFTHRPDCFGMMGVAREIAGIQQQAFTSPDWYTTHADVPAVETEVLPLEVRNELPDLVPRFTAVVMSGIVIQSSPVWLQVNLARYGLRPINNIVDLTNYFMILTGQPLHAYDYDKVKALDGGDAATIVIRQPQPGEKISLLNGKEIEPRAEAIMIASGTKLIGVGGVMGGGETEVDQTTANIIIEVANFDMYSIRRTSMAHGLFTDAVSRFNKGQSPLQTRAVLAKMVDDVRRLAGGKVASELIDIKNSAVDNALQLGTLHAPVSVDVAFINSRLGLDLLTQEMASLLKNVEFDVVVSRQSDGDCLVVKAPFWRTDIEIPEDVVEEVGRLYGFDRLPLVLPSRPMIPATKNPSLELKQQLRQTLSQAGANEVLGYSFVHGNLLDAAGQKPEDSFRLSNALSPDLQYYRQSLTPSLLDKVHANIKAGYGQFALFEIGKGHVVGQNDAEGLPAEYERLALVFAADDKIAQSHGGAPYYQAKAYLDAVLEPLGLTGKVTLEPLKPETYLGATQTKITQYATGRSAVVLLDDIVVGEIGEYQPSVRKALKLPPYSAGFELDITVLRGYQGGQHSYRQLSRYPKVEQDICLKVAATMPYQQLYSFVHTEINTLQPENGYFSLAPVDIYQRPDDQEHKQITLRLSIASYDKTLRDSEIAAIMDQVAKSAAESLSAERV